VLTVDPYGILPHDSTRPHLLGQICPPGKVGLINYRCRALRAALEVSLRKNRLPNVLRLRLEFFVPLEETHAGVPAQDRVVVARRPDALGLLE
jgi:hypothetical protein